MKRETVIIAALGILTLAGCNNNHRSQVRKFKQTAEKTNRSCPTRMNETITLDSTRYNEKDNSVSYFYSVTGELDNATYMNTHYAAFKQALQDAVDNSVEMEEYRKLRGNRIGMPSCISAYICEVRPWRSFRCCVLNVRMIREGCS